ANPEEGFRDLLSFLQASYDDRPATFFRSNRLNSSFHQRPDGSASKKNDSWQGWPVDQRLVFLGEVGPTLLEFGLATDIDLFENQYESYKQLLSKIRSVIDVTVPLGATLAVISKGDPELLNHYGRRALHLPRGDDGHYPGHHPA